VFSKCAAQILNRAAFSFSTTKKLPSEQFFIRGYNLPDVAKIGAP